MEHGSQPANSGSTVVSQSNDIPRNEKAPISNQSLPPQKPVKRRQRVLGAAWLKQEDSGVIDPINFVSLAPPDFPEILDEEEIFAKVCQFMRVDRYDDSKTVSNIWDQKHTLRPSSSSPRFTPSFLFTDVITPPAPGVIETPSLILTAAKPKFHSSTSSTSSLSAPTPIPRFPPLSVMYPNNDPRRKMIAACMKAANTMGDRTSFRKMLHRYFTRNVEWENRYVGTKNPYGPNSVKLDGISAVVQYYDRVSYIVPDNINHLQASDVILRPDGSAIIIAQFLSLGTKIFRSQTESFEHVIVNGDGQAMGIPHSTDVNSSTNHSHHEAMRGSQAGPEAASDVVDRQSTSSNNNSNMNNSNM